MNENDTPLANIEPTSPARNRNPIEGRTSLRQLPWCGKINLRGEPGDAKFLKAVDEVLGVSLPLQANTTATTSATSAGGRGVIFWLGPNEWLLHCEIAHTENLMEQLTQKLARFHHAITEVSDYYAVLELSGENAAAVLARGCPLDLHDREFKETQCAQTRFGNADILLYKPGANPLFQIQIRWSFTEYLWVYLETVIDSL